MADETKFTYDEYARLCSLVNQVSELKRTAGTPGVLARLAVVRAERDELQGRGIPVLSGAELARAKALRPVAVPVVVEADTTWQVEAPAPSSTSGRRGAR